MILAGELDQRVRLETATSTRDALNQQVRAWAPQGTVDAKVETITGSAVHLANQFQEPTTLRVTIRKGPPITSRWRVVWLLDDGIGGVLERVLAIEAILPTQNRDGWQLLCSEGLRNG